VEAEAPSLEATLIDRVDKLIEAREAPGWGSPHLSVTPGPIAVQQLAAEVATLEEVVRELALEIQKLSGRS